MVYDKVQSKILCIAWNGKVTTSKATANGKSTNLSAVLLPAFE